MVSRVRNEGNSARNYVLREVLPTGFALIDHGGAMVEESGILTWQSEIAAGAEMVHRYTLEVASAEALNADFNARLES